jgi:hypothetical protein
MDNQKMKKGFALFTTILLIFVFLSVSLMTIEVKQMDINIDKYKYLYLQSNLHLDYIIEYIIKHKKAPPWNNNIEKYIVDINSSDDNQTFDIFIYPKEEVNIRLYKQINLD